MQTAKFMKVVIVNFAVCFKIEKEAELNSTRLSLDYLQEEHKNLSEKVGELIHTQKRWNDSNA